MMLRHWEGYYMEQEIDEMNKIIHIKCTEEEKKKILAELTPYLYDYTFHFIDIDESKRS